MTTTIEKWSLLAVARFVLAFIVMVGHIDYLHYAPLGALWLVPHFGPFQAVLGFLLISGFSIGSSYGKEPAGFLKRRALRIYPVYAGALALACVAAPPTFNLHSAGTLIQNLLFLNQLTTNTSVVGPAWSLALEVWLYCLTPWLWRMQPAHVRILMYASFALFCCYELGRSALNLAYYSGIGYGLNLLLLAFPWLAGLLIAREPQIARRTLCDCALMFLGHVLLSTTIACIYRWKHAQLAEFFAHDLGVFAAQGFTLAAIVLLFKWILDGKTGTTRSSTMRLLGDTSYPLYLVHGSVFIIVASYGVHSVYIYLAAALPIAFLFYWCIDFYSRARQRKPRMTKAEPLGSTHPSL
jgi:peptidoglycan/LPS O-acetylase OafA/YrhL